MTSYLRKHLFICSSLDWYQLINGYAGLQELVIRGRQLERCSEAANELCHLDQSWVVVSRERPLYTFTFASQFFLCPFQHWPHSTHLGGSHARSHSWIRATCVASLLYIFTRNQFWDVPTIWRDDLKYFGNQYSFIYKLEARIPRVPFSPFSSLFKSKTKWRLCCQHCNIFLKTNILVTVLDLVLCWVTRKTKSTNIMEARDYVRCIPLFSLPNSGWKGFCIRKRMHKDKLHQLSDQWSHQCPLLILTKINQHFFNKIQLVSMVRATINIVWYHFVHFKMHFTICDERHTWHTPHSLSTYLAKNSKMAISWTQKTTSSINTFSDSINLIYQLNMFLCSIINHLTT